MWPLYQTHFSETKIYFKTLLTESPELGTQHLFCKQVIV